MIGNEPWGYYDASTYHAITKGFIEGIDEYYLNDPTNKIKLLTAAFQANRVENTTPANSSDNSSWKDYMNTRVCSDIRNKLVGINLHPYSNDILDMGTYHKQRLLAYPEQTYLVGTTVKAQSKFLAIRNAWKWLQANPMQKQDIYVSEYGWDSDTEGVVCGEPIKKDAMGVGFETQAIYTIRSLLMMSRYGVTKATWYQAFDDKGVANCPFAHFGGGIWKNRFDANPTNTKYIFKAFDKFIQKAGNLKFHYALRMGGQ